MAIHLSVMGKKLKKYNCQRIFDFRLLVMHLESFGFGFSASLYLHKITYGYKYEMISDSCKPVNFVSSIME